MLKRFVITGGPGFGKTTIINRLEALGYNCFHEFSRSLKLEEAKKLGGSISWTKLDERSQDDFSLKVCKRRIEQYIAAPLETVSFYDRGIPDVVAYLHMAKQPISSFYNEVITGHNYEKKVFLTPPWKEIFVNDNERIESYDEAVVAHRHLQQTYQNLGYTTLDVPCIDVEGRINYILNEVKA
jgi:predicted ATPase